MKVIAIDIGGTKIASALVTLSDGAPAVEHLERIPTQAEQGGERVLARALAAARRVLALAPDACGIGVSTAGVPDPRTGAITYANEVMPGWTGIRLGEELARSCNLDVRVLNDVHAHALGEARHGAGRGMHSCLVVAVGTGVGGAFVSDGMIMLGAHGEAGHIGHVTCTEAAGMPCACGAVGHLEPIAAGPGIIAEYLRLGGAGAKADGSPVDGAEIDARASAGDSDAIAAEQRSGRALGEVIGSMCNMLDPAGVILSGSVAQCGAFWHDALADAFARTAMPPLAHVPIRSGALGGAAPLIGAAEHVSSPAYRELIA